MKIVCMYFIYFNFRTFTQSCYLMECVHRIWKNYKTAIIIVALTFGLILPILLHHVSHSVYFIQWGSSRTKAAMKIYNNERIEWARRELKRIRPPDKSALYSETDVLDLDLTISVITMSRNRHQIDDYEPRYLTQTATKLYKLRQEFMRSSIIKYDNFSTVITICNVDSDIKSYQEDNELSWLVPHFYRNKNLYLSMDHVLEKEKQDYIFCLNQSLTMNSRYVLLVEDDAFPHDEAFHVLVHTIRNHLDSHSARGNIYKGPKQPFAFVKFYHPERLLNYLAPDVYRVVELLSLAFVVGSFVFQFQRLIFLDRTVTSLNMLWCSWIVYWILVFICIGHPNVIELKAYFSPHLYSVRPAPSCCTPAVLYPSARAPEVISFMNSKQCYNNYGKDSILDDLLKNSSFRALYVEPNIFQHIGMYSALKSTFVDPVLV